MLILVVLVLAACGRPAAVPSGPADLPGKPADYVDVFSWSQAAPTGTEAIRGVFKGPHFSYQFGALAVRDTLDETSGALEVGPARAAGGHQFLVLYRLQGDDSFAQQPDGGAALPVDVLVGTVRKRLPKTLLPGTGLIVSVPTGGDATLEVTDDKPYQYSVRKGAGGPPAPSSPADAPPAGPNAKQVRWSDGDYSGQGSYQGVRTSGPLGVTVALGNRSELGATLSGVAAAPAQKLWLRLPDAKINTDDAQLKVDMARSVTLTLPNGEKVTARPNVVGLLFQVPDTFTTGTLTIAPEFPAASTAKWSTKPDPKDVPLTVS